MAYIVTIRILRFKGVSEEGTDVIIYIYEGWRDRRLEITSQWDALY
jgi:hypothetical protein